MSDAQNCPLLYQLNSLQIQPLQSYNSCDTELDPDDLLPSDFNHDEPEPTLQTPKKDMLPINTDVQIVDAYTPPLAHDLKIRRIRIHSITKHQVDPPPKLQRNLTTVIRAQLDTGADITCTNLLHVLHNYKPYTKSFPCRVRLVGAIGKNGDENLGIYPLGEGFLHIPASTQNGYIPVCCVYSPHLTSTLLCKDDIIRTQKHLRLRDFTTTIVKYYKAGTFSLTCNHKHKRNNSLYMESSPMAINVTHNLSLSPASLLLTLTQMSSIHLTLLCSKINNLLMMYIEELKLAQIYFNYVLMHILLNNFTLSPIHTQTNPSTIL